MPQRLKAIFETRRQAELAVEHLVQAHDVDRRRIEILPQGPENSAGEVPSGSDEAAADPSPEGRGDGALEGPIVVWVELDSAEQIEAARAVFEEAGAAAP